MPYTNELLAAELELLADEARLGRGVSPEKACRDGRRILRRRRAVGGAGGVGATGLALVLAACLLPIHGRGHGGPGTDSVPGDAFTLPAGTPSDAVNLGVTGSAPASSPAAPDTTPDDPLTASATFGWMPTGFTVNGYNTDPAQPAGDIGPEGGRYSAIYEISAQTADGLQKASLAVLPAGISPILPNQVGATPATPVNGNATYWQTAPSDQALTPGEVELAWEYQPGTWAELSLTLGSGSQTTARTTALQMARQAKFGQTKAIPLPFKRVAGPAGLTTVTAGTTELNPGIVADSTWEETLSFANGPAPVGGTGNGYSALEIGVTAAELPPADAGFIDRNGGDAEADIVVDGFPAQIYTNSGYTLLVVNSAKGFGTVEIQGVGAEGTALARPGAAANVFERLELLGADPASWTVDVLG